MTLKSPPFHLHPWSAGIRGLQLDTWLLFSNSLTRWFKACNKVSIKVVHLNNLTVEVYIPDKGHSTVTALIKKLLGLLIS